MEAVWLMSVRVAGRMCISCALCSHVVESTVVSHGLHHGKRETHCRDIVQQWKFTMSHSRVYDGRVGGCEDKPRSWRCRMKSGTLGTKVAKRIML